MAVNTEKNSYTILFAIAMVVVVGSLLAFTASSLKPAITKNKEIEKQLLETRLKEKYSSELKTKDEIIKMKDEEISLRFSQRRGRGIQEVLCQEVVCPLTKRRPLL